MNLLKPLAIYFGSKFIADKLDEYANQIEGVENQLRLRVKRIFDNYDNYPRSSIRDLYDRSYINNMPATELADLLVNHPLTKKLIKKEINDGEFTETEVASLVKSTWEKYILSQYADNNNSTFKKKLKKFLSSNIIVFFCKPLGLISLTIILSLQLLGVQYLRSHNFNHQMKWYQLMPPMTFYYGSLSIKPYFFPRKEIPKSIIESDAIAIANYAKNVITFEMDSFKNANHDTTLILRKKINLIRLKYKFAADNSNIFALNDHIDFIINADNYANRNLFESITDYMKSGKIRYKSTEEYWRSETIDYPRLNPDADTTISDKFKISILKFVDSAIYVNTLSDLLKELPAKLTDADAKFVNSIMYEALQRGDYIRSKMHDLIHKSGSE